MVHSDYLFCQSLSVSPFRIGWPQRSIKAYTSVHYNDDGKVACLADNGGEAMAGSIMGTSYTSMNEWLHLPVSTAKPVTRTFSDWRELRPEEDEELPEEEKYPNLPRPQGPEDSYKRTYDDLTQQIAYRWPNPGSPRFREGRIGGTWRHIKEVLGHSGSRVVFIDGLVSVYDDQKFTQKLQAQLPYRPHIRPLYANNTTEIATPRESLSKQALLPEVAPASSVIRDPNVRRKLELQDRFDRSRRGFYAFKKQK
ncbi:hypothetical protein BaRGS_00033485 [Batillaria attramentaria]|uniref:Uncharacterized protein n=1 Tax=Batillaria attramentaria TaxID=370345 RepID=A0ABD0JK77_9CAEN